MNKIKKTTLSILLIFCAILSKGSINAPSQAFAKNASTTTSSKAKLNSLVVQDYKGDTFTLQLNKKYTNVKLCFIELADGSISDANVSVKNSTVSVTNAYDVPMGATSTLNLLLKTGKVETYAFTTDTNIKIDLNSQRDYFIPANPSKGFYFPYFISFKGISNLADYKSTMMFDTSNNHLSFTNEETFSQLKYTIKNASHYVYDIGAKGNYITVMFVFPRPWQDPVLYTHSLDRDSLTLTQERSDALNRGNLVRLDLQYLAVIKDAKAQVTANNKKVDDKVFLFGFSASADFATRFTLLHPAGVKAVVVNASPTMPFSSYNGVTLNYPLGIADLKSLVGTKFNATAFKKVPQFWHSGSIDDNDGTYFGDGWGNYGDDTKDWNAEGIDYRKAFGDEITSRKRLVAQALQEKGFTNITFKEYKGVSHEMTSQMQSDILEFLRKIK